MPIRRRIKAITMVISIRVKPPKRRTVENALWRCVFFILWGCVVVSRVQGVISKPRKSYKQKKNKRGNFTNPSYPKAHGADSKLPSNTCNTKPQDPELTSQKDNFPDQGRSGGHRNTSASRQVHSQKKDVPRQSPEGRIPNGLLSGLLPGSSNNPLCQSHPCKHASKASKLRSKKAPRQSPL
jgi:hypothetical protein